MNLSSSYHALTAMSRSLAVISAHDSAGTSGIEPT